MSREDEIRQMFDKQKGPSSKKYLIILLVAALVLIGYLAASGEWKNILNLITPEVPPQITSTAEAGQINSNLGKGLQNASNVLDDLSNVLG